MCNQGDNLILSMLELCHHQSLVLPSQMTSFKYTAIKPTCQQTCPTQKEPEAPLC